MMITGFDNKEYLFNYTKHRARKNRSNKSSYHFKVRELLKQILPQYSVYEEITLPGSKKPSRKNVLYADFFLPEFMLIIEVHGEQHYAYSSFFHKDKMDFYKSVNRDKDKSEWCHQNGIKYIELKYNEEAEWKSKILSATINQ